MAIKVGMISLGCAKNLVDAEIMLGSVLERGMEVTSIAEDADVLVVNTCAFIDSAKEESIDAILEAHQTRGLTKHEGQRLIVSGCMSQRFSRELHEQLPEVDAFIGLDQVRDLGAIVDRIITNPEEAPRDFVTARPSYIPDYDTPRFRLTPAHTAYLKIAEGCNHPCSFCVIPQMRGRHRSRAPESVLAEIRALVAEGVREINLISQIRPTTEWIYGRKRLDRASPSIPRADQVWWDYCARLTKSKANSGCDFFIPIRPIGVMSSL